MTISGLSIDQAPNALMDELERIVDKASLCTVLNTLAQIAFAKADHIERNWQDTGLARRWNRTGDKLDKLADTTVGL